MQVDQNRGTGGIGTILGGMDSGRAPALIRGDQVAFAINTTFRGGYPMSRPPIVQRQLVFESGTVGRWFLENYFQGAAWYEGFQDDERLVAMVGGRLFVISPLAGFLVQEITPMGQTTVVSGFTVPFFGSNTVQVLDASKIQVGHPVFIGGKEYTVQAKAGDVLTIYTQTAIDGTVVSVGDVVGYLDSNPTRRQVWFEQAEQYLVIQDGLSAPIIYDGTGTRRSKFPSEVPTGTIMAYGNGRLWVAVNGQREFVAGDIAGGPTGVLGFTENTYLTGGGAFKVRANSGRITAMRFVTNLDTSLGQGPLQVLTKRAIYSVNAPTAREAWSVVTDPIQTVSMIDRGATSQASTILSNGDLFYRSSDGLRSFIIARRDFGQWGNTPISREMTRIIKSDTVQLLGWSSAVVFDNRLLMTCSPTPGENGVWHRGIMALDFDLIGGLSGKSPPAYDGLWTGCYPYQLVTGTFAEKERAFIFARSAGDTLELYEFQASGKFDNRSTRIESSIEFTTTFGNENAMKRLKNAEASLSEAFGTVDLEMKYRPDNYPCWQDWNSRQVCITYQDCDTESGCKLLDDPKPTSKSRIGFGQPSDVDNESDEKPMRLGYEFQLRLKWTGYAQFKRIILHAEDVVESPSTPPTEERSDCRLVSCCNPSLFSYLATCPEVQAPIPRNIGGGRIDLAWYANAGVSYVVHRVFVNGSGALEDIIVATFVPEETGLYVAEIQEDLAAGTFGTYYLQATGTCGVQKSGKTQLMYVW